MTAVAAVTQLRAHQGGLAAWESEREAWFIHLRAMRRSPNTLSTYAYALRAFVRFRESQGASLDPATVTRRDAEGFNIWMQDQGWTPAQAITFARRVADLDLHWFECGWPPRMRRPSRPTRSGPSAPPLSRT